MATRRLVVEVVGNASSLSRAFRGASDDTKRLGGSIGSLSVGFGQLIKGTIIVEGVQKALEGLGEALHLGIEGFSDTTRVAAQTAAVIKSTGDASNLSAKQIHGLAAALSNVSGIDDEVIQSGENVLLSFKQIRDFAGKNNDIFTQATKVVTDYAARTGKDLPNSALIIGRALADPASKATALSRAGIVLTKSQLAGLKSLEKTSGVIAAQQKLLQLLRARYEGAAAAAGRTLPGQLNILRERFKDLAGEIVGSVVPAFSGVIKGLTDFVVKLTETKGARAKFNLTIDTGKDAARGAFEKLRKEFDSVDWSAVGKTIQDGLRTIPPEIAHAVGRIDFGAIAHSLGEKLKAVFKFDVENVRILGREIVAGFKQINFGAIGRDLGDAFSRLLNFISAAVKKVDWNRVGRDLVVGAGALVVAVARFLAGVNWGAVFGAIGRFADAALRAVGGVLLGIGEELGKAVLRGLGKGLDAIAAFVGEKLNAAARFLARKADEIVLKIIEPFTHLPGLLGGGPFQKLQATLQAQLGLLKDPAFKSGKAVGDQVIAGINAGLQGTVGTPTIPTPKLPPGVAPPVGKEVLPGIASRNATAGFTPDLPPLPPPPPRKGLTAAQRNQFFDNAISSELTRAGFLTNVKQQISALQTIAGLISARIAATKDVTRRRTLEDQLLGVESQILGDRAQVASDFLSALQFGITKAQATATFNDDIAAFKALESGIKAQIKATGDTLDLEQQLFAAVQGLKAAKTSQLSAKDFKILGFTATGDDVTPGLKRLRKEFASVSAAISGTSLDTSKVKTELAAIKAVISDALVPQDVRAKMQELLANLQKQLADHAGNLTKFSKVNANALAKSLGLDPAQTRQFRATFSQIGAGGTIHGTGQGAFGFALPSAPSGTVVHKTVVNLDGKPITTVVTKHQQKNRRRNPVQKRGPNTGGR